MNPEKLIQMAAYIRGNAGLSDAQRATLHGIQTLVEQMRAVDFNDAEIAMIIGGYIAGEVPDYSAAYDPPIEKPAGSILYFTDPVRADGAVTPFDAFDSEGE